MAHPRGRRVERGATHGERSPAHSPTPGRATSHTLDCVGRSVSGAREGSAATRGPGRCGQRPCHQPAPGVDPSLTYSQTDLSLPPESRLLLYTDGLVERRHLSITDRLDTLADVAADHDPHGHGGLTGLCDHILTHVAGPAGREDDLCLLAAQTP
ncbi:MULTISPECIES: SpoIIE family protein phosphatase [unclassified Pseudofrankia]|uniref:SpoIIE family protein phosphatase n=1 Tax=unclassified Pseudofrankia TaxID=2994372 RepID=UPI0008D99E12|nr:MULTISPECIES: SpoIIE family protein phosphatase [unclassified Pseudofrankia]MDT3442985.1 SpoIIE family protein phosphatase [Pseudofrankia sp. BMG5.37]OHV43012.1 hypothetical protein BCD48_29140 [Pseudofrankia sp. BMG5.36]